MMTFNEFTDKVRQEMQERYPFSEAETQEIHKLQGESYTGLTIKTGEERAHAIANLDKHYEKLKNGMSFEEVMESIENVIYGAELNLPEMSLDDLEDYDSMKEKLIMQLVPTDRNAGMLKNVPHEEIDDLSVVYRFMLGNDENGLSSTLITDNLLKRCGVSEAELRADAAIYAPLNAPASVKTMAEQMSELTGIPIEETERFAPPMYVATVEGLGTHGASVIAYPGFFENAAEKLGGDFYVLPSSIHEVLLLPHHESYSAKDLTKMVRDVNSQEVSIEDRLSDHAYHYDAKDRIFESAESYEERINAINAERNDDKTDLITVLRILPGEYPEVARIGTELKDLQAEVGGYIEVTYPFDDNVCLIVNEEGKLNGMELNRSLKDEHGAIQDILAGPIIVAALSEDDFSSLSPAQINKYGEMFKAPETFVKLGKSFISIPKPESDLNPRDVKTAQKAAKPRAKLQEAR